MKKITTAFVFLIMSAAHSAYGEAPNLLTYQGRLKESGQAVSGNRTVEIFLCDAETGPTCHTTGAQSVTVSNGLFRSTFTIPGSANFGAGNWWLEIKVGINTLTPREQFTSNAYAMFAATAAYASNIAAAEGSSGVTISSNLYVSGGFAVGASTLVVINGNVGVNTANPTYPLHVQAAAGAEDTLYLKDSGQNVSLVMMSQLNYDAKIEVPNGGSGLTMEIGSVPSVHISSAYNAGFGTMNPAARVHISSAAGEAGNMLIVSTGTSDVIRLTGAGEVYANKYYGDGSALSGIAGMVNPAIVNLNMTGFDIVDVSTISVSSITVLSGPGVSVSTHLYVNGNIYGDGSQLSGVAATSYTGTLPVANGGTGTTSLTGVIKGNGTGTFSAMAGTTNRVTRWSDNNTIAASAQITDNGTAVGIGTTLPDQRLTVAGDISQTGVIISSGAGDNYFAGKVGIGTNTPDSGVKLHVSGGNIGLDNNTYLRWKNSGGGMSDVMWVGTDNNLNFRLPNPSSYTFFDSGSNPLFVILNSGQIGVNTAAPGYALDVSGSINASSNLCIAGNCKSSWPFTPGSQVLQMGAYAVISSSHISAAAYQVNGSTALAAFSSLEGLSAGLNTGPQNSGSANTFVGHNTGLLNTTGANNTFVGRGAGATNMTGGQNVFIGKDAGIMNMTGSANAVIGVEAASVSGLFSSSTLAGYQAGYNLGTSIGNILIGYKAGYNIDTGTGNIIIGFEKDTPASNTDSHLNIGGAIFGNLITGSIGIGTNAPMAALDVKSTGTLVTQYAQIWRASDGTIVASMTATGKFHTQDHIPAAVSATAQSTTGLVEEVLMSYTLPANALNVDGKGVKVKAWGTTALNANVKNIRLKFGGLAGTILVQNTVTTTPNEQTWIYEATILRASSSVQKTIGSGYVGIITQGVFATGPAQNDAAAIDIVVSGETPTAIGDITAEGLIVEMIN